MVHAILNDNVNHWLENKILSNSYLTKLKNNIGIQKKKKEILIKMVKYKERLRKLRY